MSLPRAPPGSMVYLIRIDEADELVAAPEAAQAVAVDVLLRPLPASGGQSQWAHMRALMAYDAVFNTVP